MIKNSYFFKYPIIDNKGKIFAYKIRPSVQTNMKCDKQKQESALSLLSVLQNYNLATITKPLLVEITPELITTPLFESFKSKKLLFLLELSPESTEELMQALSAKAQEGYKFVYKYDEKSMANSVVQKYLCNFSYAFIDSSKTFEVAIFSEYDIEIIINKVKSVEAFSEFLKKGAHYCLGTFYKNQTVKYKKIDPAQVEILNLIKLAQKKVNISVLEERIKEYADLSINLIKYINSAHFSTQREIMSIHHALSLMGHQKFIQWLMLFLYSSAKKNHLAGTLLALALSRVKIMKLLHDKITTENLEDEIYLVAFLSFFEKIFLVPLEVLFRSTNFSQELVLAVTKHEGTLGKLLKLSAVIERGDVDFIESLCKKLGLQTEDITKILEESMMG